MAWSQRFNPAVPLPGGGELQTLADARRYILDLPGDLQTSPPWQNAVEALLLVGTNGGDPMLPRIGMMRALYPGKPGTTPRRKRAKVYKIIR
jgi:hypothetical protein